MRHAAKRDANEPEIVRALELSGWTVIPVSDTGVMDLLCIRRGVVRLLEVKGPKGKLTPAQERTFARIHAAGGTVHVVRTPAEALHAVALGVESELGPVAKMDALYRAVKAAPQDDMLIPVHPDSIAGQAIRRLVEERGFIDEVIHPDRRPFSLGGIVVTPAYQKAQTEAVVPKRRMLAVKCECGHARGDHTSGRGVCMDGPCECVQFAADVDP